MTDTSQTDAIQARVQEELNAEPIYRGASGRMRLSDLLPGGVRLAEIIPRIVHIVSRPYREHAEEQAAKLRASSAEKAALSRKINQVPEVVVWEDFTLAEVREVLRLREEGVSVARIAALFEVPAANIKTIYAYMDGKHDNRVVFSSEMRRRRRDRLNRPPIHGARLIDLMPDIEQEEHDRIHE